MSKIDIRKALGILLICAGILSLNLEAFILATISLQEPFFMRLLMPDALPFHIIPCVVILVGFYFCKNKHLE